MTNKNALFTIVSKNYISFGRTLLNSVRKFNDKIDIYMLLADECDDYFDKLKENFIVIDAKSLNINNFEQMAFRYNIVEFNTSLKPFFIQYLFSQGYEKIIYLDPDIMVFNSLAFIYELLDLHSFVLTPHLTRPIYANEKSFPPENVFLLAGTFNLGFIGISNKPDSSNILSWWSNKCASECFIDFNHAGYFVDQKWCTLFPGFSNNIFILRHQGCNVAVWNLHERELKNDFVNMSFPLVFYHFSGFDPNNFNSISKNQTIYTLNNRPDLRNIFNEYTQTVFKYGYVESKYWPYKYATFDNGVSISTIARQLYPQVESLYPNPFSTEPNSYYSLLMKKKLIHATKFNANSKNQMSQSQVINKYRLFIKWAFKILLKLIGPNRYVKLLDFISKIVDIRKQGYLLK